MATDLKLIRSEAGYDAAMVEVVALWGAVSGTPDGDRLDALVTLIDAYDAKHHDLDESDWIEGDHVGLRSAVHGVAEAQVLYRAHVVEDQSSADFLESRRAEAALENKD